MKPRKPKKHPPRKPARRGKAPHLTFLPPGATKEEDRQFDEMRHPWGNSTKDFLARVCSEYGFELICLQRGNTQNYRLKSLHDDREIPIPAGYQMDEQLDEFTTGSLCRQIGIPPEDFGLSPEEPYDETCEFDFGDDD